MHEQSRETSVAIHERMQQHETEAHQRGPHQRRRGAFARIGHARQPVHEFAETLGRWRQVAHRQRAAPAPLQPVLRVPERELAPDRTRDDEIPEIDQVVLGERAPLVHLRHRRNRPGNPSCPPR